ncbi:MAG: helix-turn-helix domain-containing protein [Pseudomonadota bacterium]
MEQPARTPKQIGAIVRRQRRRLALSQSELAEKTGLRQATISALEAGEQSARLRTLFDVMSALGVEMVVRDRRKASPEDIF